MYKSHIQMMPTKSMMQSFPSIAWNDRVYLYSVTPLHHKLAPIALFSAVRGYLSKQNPVLDDFFKNHENSMSYDKIEFDLENDQIIRLSYSQINININKVVDFDDVDEVFDPFSEDCPLFSQIAIARLAEHHPPKINRYLIGIVNRIRHVTDEGKISVSVREVPKNPNMVVDISQKYPNWFYLDFNFFCSLDSHQHNDKPIDMGNVSRSVIVRWYPNCGSDYICAPTDDSNMMFDLLKKPTVKRFIHAVIETLSEHPTDVPFLAYVCQDNGTLLRPDKVINHTLARLNED